MIKNFIILLTLILTATMVFTGCQRQADKVSHNLSLEAANFNVARKITVINLRTDTILYQVTGNFSITKESDGDLAIIGENSNGTYYKHFVKLADELTYVLEDKGTTGVNKYDYQVNFNPKMLVPLETVNVD